jgi:hypothetical protein
MITSPPRDGGTPAFFRILPPTRYRLTSSLFRSGRFADKGTHGAQERNRKRVSLPQHCKDARRQSEQTTTTHAGEHVLRSRNAEMRCTTNHSRRAELHRASWPWVVTDESVQDCEGTLRLDVSNPIVRGIGNDEHARPAQTRRRVAGKHVRKPIETEVSARSGISGSGRDVNDAGNRSNSHTWRACRSN